MAKDIGDYRNELNPLYNAIHMINAAGESKYRQVNGLSQEEYLFSNMHFLKKFEERYSISELREILQTNSREYIETVDSLAGEINQKLEEKSENVSDLGDKIDEIEKIVGSGEEKE